MVVILRVYAVVAEGCLDPQAEIPDLLVAQPQPPVGEHGEAPVLADAEVEHAHLALARLGGPPAQRDGVVLLVDVGEADLPQHVGERRRDVKVPPVYRRVLALDEAVEHVHRVFGIDGVVVGEYAWYDVVALEPTPWLQVTGAKSQFRRRLYRRTFRAVNLLECSLQKTSGVAYSLQQSSIMDQICVSVDICPRALIVVDIFHPELQILHNPLGLNWGDVDANDSGTWELISDYESGQCTGLLKGSGQLHCTILWPKAESCPHIYDLLRIGAYGRPHAGAFQNVVHVELVLYRFSLLFQLVVGHTVAALNEALIAPVHTISGRRAVSGALNKDDTYRPSSYVCITLDIRIEVNSDEAADSA